MQNIPEYLQNSLLQWYRSSRRDLPWRKNRDPYSVWISEVILQQTQVSQGTAYFLRFMERFPTVDDLASAEPDTLMKTWEGLGYYSRARNLHIAARDVVARFASRVPTRYDDLISLKGIGPYTAAAIASICGNEPVAVVDGNVFRVISRLFGINLPRDSTAGQKLVRHYAIKILNRDFPGDHNQAMMELGALVCRPRKPECPKCPFIDFCFACQTGKTEQLPVKKSPVNPEIIYLHYMVINKNGHLLIRHRNQPGIWSRLYDLPNAQFKEESPDNATIISTASRMFYGHPFRLRKIDGPLKHRLTHRLIIARFYHLETERLPEKNPEFIHTVTLNDLLRYPMPSLLIRYLQSCGLLP